MKVCLVTGEFPPVIGGIASHVFELARALGAEGVDVTVVHPVPPGSRMPNVGVPNSRLLRPTMVRAKPIYDFLLARWLRRRVAEEGFDLVHVHGVRPLAATRRLAAPVVFTNHSSGFLARRDATQFRRRRTAALLRHVRYLLAPSDELVEAARSFGYAGPAEMIANGVDTEKFTPAPEGSAAPRREPVIVLARRLAPKNGVVWFARALAELRAEAFRVVVAGEGVERAAMDEILREANLTERVEFLGAVANAEMPALYRRADIAVLPSLAEATSIAGLEAMACGLPLLGTRVGGIPAIVEDGVSGLLVEPRDPAAMARALETLLVSPEMRRRMGRAGRASVEASFSWPIIARRTIEAYKKCLAS